MLGTRLTALALVCLCVSSACATEPRDPGDASAATDADMADAAAATAELPANVDAVLQLRCRICHSDPPQNDAPFPLVTWQNTHAPAPTHEGSRIYEIIAIRIHDPNFPMPPKGNPLTDADRRVLDDWIDAGAPPAR